MRVGVLVVAAHPDDETIGAASVLLRAERAAVVHVTDGAPRDPALRPAGPADRGAYARLRREESLVALAEAGLAPPQVLSLGAVDQEVAAAIAPLARELAAALRALRPRVLVTHAVEGGHPDHDGTAVAARAAVALAGARAPRLVEMTSYHLRGGALETGAFLAAGAPVPESVHALDAAERAVKARMLAAYASQREVLAPFRADLERFRRAPPLRLAARPHPAPLHYEALGWTTFEAFREAARAALGALALGALEAG